MRRISFWGPLQKPACVWGIALVLSSAFALAQTEQSEQPWWGTSDAPTATDSAFETEVVAPVAAHATYTTAQFGSGGVGLRNRGTGGINIAGVITPVKAAFLYWAVITTGAAKAADTQLKVQRLFPTPASALTTVTGTLIGTGGSPCWPGNAISVYRAVVPTTLATGNGFYQVTLLPGAGGSTAGGDPWVGTPVLPLFEGASLVVVGTGPSGSRVVIYDSGLAGKTFHGNPGFSYTLTLPAATTGKLTLFESIGADGQEGASRLAESGNADESTYINGVYVAGPFSLFNDSDWNGSSGKPIPQLWDDVGHNITTATPSGTKTLSVSIGNEGESSYDCMTPVANVVQEE
jgi:hypothetical protein